MITPDKHTDIRYSVMYVAGVVMLEVKANGIIHYDDLMNAILAKVGERAKEVFPKALSFLYLLGRIAYLAPLDAIQSTEQ
ncbi:MAG: hypothetical protein RLZZ519_2865 [Bacteroidota bacterium]|jgi:hypothetical protein